MLERFRHPFDIKAAKSLLYQVLARKLDERYGNTVVQANRLLVDIILEEFRVGRDSKVKIDSFSELKILVSSMADFFGKSYDPSQSQLIIPLTLTMRRMGPLAEYTTMSNGVFMGCMLSLQDDSSWNDKESFRMLAKVLMCMGGADLEKEARIAATCQFYVMDIAKWRSDHSEEHIKQEGAEKKKGTALDEDIDPLARIFCSGCHKNIDNWKGGAVYLCTYCTATDLCEECFKKRTAVERGQVNDWFMVCQKGHRHVKAPVEGWKGVSNGILRMDENLEFSDWLSRFRVEWDAAWLKFWEDETV
jgi:hypothetical protein